MAKDCKDILLNREGTSQAQRFIAQLAPESLKLMDYDQQDWVLFAYNFAKHINFFNTSDSNTTVENWQELFNLFELPENLPPRGTFEYNLLKTTIDKALVNYEDQSNLTPHLTLFVCFLRLMELVQHRFNNLSKRHLDFYYKDILKIEKKLPKPDKAHIIFELAKRTQTHKIEESTGLDGGKDSLGTTRLFKTIRELVVNKAKVGSIKSIYNSDRAQEIKYAAQANSLDGLGAELPEDSPFWFPFGYTKALKDTTNPESELVLPEGFTELPDAQLGFAIASPMLALAHGKRNIFFDIEFKESVSLPSFSTQELVELITLQYSGEKKWNGPVKPETVASFFDSTGAAESNLTTSLGSKRLNLAFSLTQDLPACTTYNKELLLDNFDSELPVAKIYINTTTPRGYELFRALVHQGLAEIEIRVSVFNVSQVHLENDNGLLKAEKPFYPFSTQPIKSSNFYIDYREAFSKNWKAFNVAINWKDAPESFIDHYYAYKSEASPTTNPSAGEDALLGTKVKDGSSGSPIIVARNEPEDGITTKAIPGGLDQPKRLAADTLPDNLIVNSEGYFTATAQVLENLEQETPLVGVLNNVNLFTVSPSGKQAKFNFYKTPLSIDKTGPVKITLDNSFLHREFPRIYALALAKDETDPEIPLAPYTPLAESIVLSYSAVERSNFNRDSELKYNTNRIKLYHLTNFGLHEEHRYLKQNAVAAKVLDNTQAASAYLVPDYCLGGECYIGLEDALPNQNTSLLFQILEGSENPAVASFAGNQKVSWSVLCNNQWKDITDDITLNNIDNFLQSGIVNFPLPKQSTLTNTRLDSGLIWIRAKIHKDFDAVCKLINVHAQAVTAAFDDNNNNLDHLNTGLEASTIGKLITRVPQIKSLNQPYNSFGHEALEEDAFYYRRVSERLRHKNCAITIWDYEHIVLEAFPEVYKVLCLKHTNGQNMLAPGHVTLVVIPDIINKNVFDIYQPRVSTATLNKIKAHINKLNSLHVEAQVINPEYERVTVQLGVQFYKGFDRNFYEKQLDEDITKFLSPWAFDSTKNIAFGIALHSSVLIDYIEELPYVDYLENLQLTINEGAYVDAVSPSKPGAILVSASNHIIKPVTQHCGIEPISPKETCQY